jgi:ketosteroid isomerase-like protein
MRALLGCVAGLVVLACGASGGGQALLDTDRTWMRASVDTFAAYVVTHRDSMAAAMFADNGTLMPPNQPLLQGRAAIRAFIKGYPPMRHFTASAVDINGRADLAYVRGTYQISFMSGADDHGKYLEVLRRQNDGRWLVIADIFNSDVAAK